MSPVSRSGASAKRDWCRWDGGQTLSCERCGEVYVMNLPASLNIAAAIARAFMKDHRHCPKKAERVGDET